MCCRIVPERTAFVIERFGKYVKTLTPGLHLLIPFVSAPAMFTGSVSRCCYALCASVHIDAEGIVQTSDTLTSFAGGQNRLCALVSRPPVLSHCSSCHLAAVAMLLDCTACSFSACLPTSYGGPARWHSALLHQRVLTVLCWAT